MIKIDDDGWTFRLLPDALRTLRIKPQGVIHVGAHHGEEVPTYQQCGFEAITLIEPDPASWKVLTGAPWSSAISALPVACAATEGTTTFHRTADDVFSGLLPNLSQQTVSTFEVPTLPVSVIQASYPANVLVIDTQGTELDVLRSADVAGLDLVVIETQQDGPNAHGAYWPDLMTWATGHGWEPTVQWARDPGWADTLLTPGVTRG